MRPFEFKSIFRAFAPVRCTRRSLRRRSRRTSPPNPLRSLHPHPPRPSPCRSPHRSPNPSKSPSPPIAHRSALWKVPSPPACSPPRLFAPPPASPSTINCASFPASSSFAAPARSSPIPPRRESAFAPSVPPPPAALLSLKTMSRSTIRSAVGFTGRSSPSSPSNPSNSFAAARAIFTVPAPSAAWST